MLVLEQAKALLLKLDNPSRVMECIPTAKQVVLQGAPLLAVPHSADEVRVLRNLGIKAPAPILHYYDYPGVFPPFHHQRMTAAFLTMNKKALVLNEIGTGKTNAALWAADYLISIGLVKKVLIVSPLSTLERVWGDAIFKGFPNRKGVVLYGTAKRRLQLLGTKADFYVINHDGFGIISDQCTGMFDLVIADEAAILRNPSTRRFKIMRRWMNAPANSETRLWLMTGTPTPNNPTDAWALAQLVNNPYVARTFSAFREQTMQRFGQYTYVPRPGSQHTVKHVLQPSVRYTRDECFDLPDTITQTREVPLSAQQRTVYDKMLKHFIVEAAAEKLVGGTITAVNEAIKVQKLVQIACGVAYDDYGNDVEIDCSPRVNATIEIIEEVGGKVIVFVPLTGTLHMLERKLKEHWSVGVVNGAVPMAKRNIIFQNFQESPEPRIILAHPACMAHGLTLTAASTIIWYGPINSNEQYVQANGRIERVGKKHTSNIIHIEATAVERKMYQRLASRQRLQGLLLELIQEETER